MDGTLRASTDRTHLFPGAIVVVDTPAEPRAAALDLRFSDGATAGAELLTGDDERLVLSVDGYTTGAGTVIPAKLWALTDWQGRDDGSAALRIGARLPFAPAG